MRIVVVLAFLGIAVLVGLGVATWFAEGTKVAVYQGCIARIIEHDILEDRKTEFLDNCMAANAYRRTGPVCDDGPRFDLFRPPTFCYNHRWMVW